MPENLSIPPDLKDVAAAGLPTRPPEFSTTTEPSNRLIGAGIAAAAVGAATYEFVPTLLNLKHGTATDETAAFLAAIATLLLASLRDAKILCWSNKQRRQEDAVKVAQGAAGGLLSGAAIATFTKAALFSLFDGGILLGTLTLGAVGAAALSHAQRTKYCPHCGGKGICTQRVCRHCYRIFYPLVVDLDCKKHITLSWFHIASFLQEQGLNYLDSEGLLRKFGSQWGLFQQPRQLQVDCAKFSEWVERSKADIVASIGAGSVGQSKDAIDLYLKQRDL